MFLKKSLKILKEKFYTLFLVELAFLFITFFFLVFAKNKIAAYVLQLQAFSGQAAIIQQGADQAQVAQFLETFQNATNNAMAFIYIAIPIALILIYKVTQTGFWYSLKKEHIKNKKAFILKSILGHLTFILPFYLALVFISAQFSIFDPVDTAIIKGVIGVIMVYGLLIFMGSLDNKSYKETMLLTLRKMTRKYILLLPFLFLVGVFSLLIFLFFSLFTTYMTGAIVVFSTIPLTLYLLVVMALVIWLKVIFSIKVQES